MPTISQLPATSQVTAADQLPISQGGSACSVDVGSLLATTQPAIMIATGSLFGRTSLGPGGPEPVTVGTGLLLNSTTLAANGTDHAGFPSEGALSLTDQAVVNSAGSPKLLPLPLLRGLFSPGSNIAIDENGTISATVANGTSGYSITALPTVATISAGDLVAISQAGTDHTITYANLVDGQTIDEAQAADAASDADTFLVAQNSNVMTRQTLAAMWAWLNAKLVSYQMPTLELTTNTTLSATAHNGHMLICSQTLTLTPAPTAMGSGFSCTLLNVSDGNITLGSGITTSSGNAIVPPGQTATVSCATYSGGTLVYAWISGATSSPAVPGQVSGVSAGLVTVSSVALSWTPLSPSPASYTVQYRIQRNNGLVAGCARQHLGVHRRRSARSHQLRFHRIRGQQRRVGHYIGNCHRGHHRDSQCARAGHGPHDQQSDNQRHISRMVAAGFRRCRQQLHRPISRFGHDIVVGRGNGPDYGILNDDGLVGSDEL